jgi:hypothetical protein
VQRRDLGIRQSDVTRNLITDFLRNRMITIGKYRGMHLVVFKPAILDVVKIVLSASHQLLPYRWR